MQEFEDAKDKVMMGAERRSMVMTDDEKKMTAYHEAGHAIVSVHEEASDPIHKATIIPRGQAMGVTMALPEKDRYGYQKMEIEGRLAMMFGGRLAEELIYGTEDITTGAGNDIKQATELAQRMITEWGMSERLGPLNYSGGGGQEVFLGDGISREGQVSEHTARLIDEEVRRVIDEAEERARTVLTEHIDDLHRLARGLLEYETLSAEEAQAVMQGQDISRGDGGGSGAAASKPAASVPNAGRGKRGEDRGGGWDPTPQPT